MRRVLRCYAHGSGASWEAICIDLDISVNGTSYEAVRQQLGRAIDTYIEDARKEEPHQARRLLSRKAPLRVRVGYEISRMFQKRKDTGGRDRETYAGFDIPCHA